MVQNPQLEAAIIERPNDAARYAVYGDWLQAQGDLRGELVSVQAALASTSDTKRFLELKETETRLLASVAAQIAPAGAQVKFGWRFGFVHRVELLDPDFSLTRLLQHPALRFLQGVRLAMPTLNHSSAISELIAVRPPLLNRLELVDGSVRNLAAFREAFPRLEHFSIEALPTTEIDASVLLEWPELRTLEIIALAPTDGLLATLRLAPWKKLRRLTLRPGQTRERSTTIDDVKALLALPELKSIAVTGWIDDAVAAIAKRPNLSALQDLEIFDYLTTERIKPLLARAEAIRTLKLVIHHGELSLAVVQQLRKAVKGLALGVVEVFEVEEAGVHEMDEGEARDWREREERRETQGDYNRDEWN